MTEERGARGGTPGSGRDWATEATDRLEEVVTKIRSQTTDRILRVARILVFGLVAVVVATMAVVLLVVAAIRLADTLIPQEVWLTYLVVGGLLTFAGMLLWSKKDRRPSVRS